MKKKPGFSQIELAITLGALILLAAVAFPFVRAARNKARLNASSENLKYLALAIHNYEDVFQRIPTGGWVVGEEERFGWPAVLLPYISNAHIYNRLNHNEAWHHHDNQPHLKTSIQHYLVPGSSPVETAEGYGMSQYAANSNLMHRNSSVRIAQITHGTANVLMLGETAGEYRPWGCSWNWRTPQTPFGPPATFGNQIASGTQFVLADGNVKLLNPNIDPKVLQQISDSGYVPRSEDLVRPPIPASYPSESH
jgi:type II secretory pathway pseudopilin PulG